MKSVIKICNMESHQDIKLIQETVANNSGVIASEISLAKKEIIIIYNEAFLNIEKIINSIEDLGYIVILIIKYYKNKIVYNTKYFKNMRIHVKM